MKHPVSRRVFLGGAASAFAFTFVPGRVLGAEGQPPASDKLNVAGIGCSGKGASDVGGMASTENIVALCDIDENYAAGTFDRFPQARKFKDYRVMLQEMEKQIDVVTVSTADHSHAPASMMALKMGKHCFTQKPLTYSIFEARRLGEMAREKKVATVMGIQGHCGDNQRVLCEWIWAGVLGPVRELHIWTDRPGRWWKQGLERPKETPPCPPHIDWNLWLGPAPERPYHPVYHPVAWRGWWDFGTGALGDIGCHALDGPFWALKLAEAKTFEVQAVHSGHNGETYPNWSVITYEFPARGELLPPLKFVWYDGGKTAERPKELEPDRQLNDNGQIIVGDKATLFNGRIIPETKMKEMQPGLPRPTLPRIPDANPERVYGEFKRAIRGGTPCGANFPDFAGPLAEIVLAGNLALRTPKKIAWDVAAMRSTNVPEINQFVHREYRKGWTL